MKSILALSLMLSSVLVAVAQTRFDATITVDSVPREFIIVRPSGAAPAGGFPLVFMFHGTSGDGEKFYNISGWKEKGEAEKFITVFPSSLTHCFVEDGIEKNNTKWNCGDLLAIACPNQLIKDDVKFVRMMLDTIEKTFNIDRRRIFASGFSNGGCFVSKLSIEMSDVFAAIGANSGPLNALDSGTPARYVPVTFMVGTMDDRFYTAIGQPSVPFNDSTADYYFRTMLGRYLGSYDLADTYTKTGAASALTYAYTLPLGATPRSTFTFMLHKDLTHEYPNGTNYPFSAADYYWDFFKQAVPASDVRATQLPTASCALAPNPAFDYVSVPGEGSGVLTLYSALGQRVCTQQFESGARIPIDGLPVGAYIADIMQRGIHHSTTIVIAPR